MEAPFGFLVIVFGIGSGTMKLDELASFLLTVVPLLYISNDTVYFPLLLVGEAGSILNKVYWVNKVLLGSIIGALVTLFAYYSHIYIKKINGKVLFPFQGVALTLAFLFASGLSMYFIFGV